MTCQGLGLQEAVGLREGPREFQRLRLVSRFRDGLSLNKHVCILMASGAFSILRTRRLVVRTVEKLLGYP